MNVNELYDAIDDPVGLPALTAEELEALVSHYPYFPAAQILLTRAYRKRNDHRLSDQLHQAALFTGSRKLLREIIRTEPAEMPESEPIVFQLHEEGIEVFAESNSTVQPQEELHVAGSSKPEYLETPVLVSEKVIPVAISEAMPVPEQQDAVVVEIGDTTGEQEVMFIPQDWSPVDREIMVQAVRSSIEQEVEEDATELRNARPPKRESPPAEPQTYEEWMLRRAKEVHYGQGDEDESHSKSVDYDDSIPSISHGKTRIHTDHRSIQRNLIDQFIQTEPKITPGKADEYSQRPNLARNSLEDDMSLVTETMARIYEQQGRLDKARAVYRKLIEIHPEKSIYFAALLKNLEKSKK